jgi:hypothetical protein
MTAKSYQVGQPITVKISGVPTKTTTTVILRLHPTACANSGATDL